MKLTLGQQEVPECTVVWKLSLVRQRRAKCRHTLCRVDDEVVALGQGVVRDQRKYVVKVRSHTAGVKVHEGRPVGILRFSVIVHEYYDHDVVANVTFPLQLYNGI